jgi:hypothetical protein
MASDDVELPFYAIERALNELDGAFSRKKGTQKT